MAQEFLELAIKQEQKDLQSPETTPVKATRSQTYHNPKGGLK
jgi:hypothetical protein